jgi:hypothetical protein
MAFVVANNTRQTNLSIYRPVNHVTSNRMSPEGPVVYHRQDVGSVSTVIPAIALTGQCISMAPTSASQNYTLPTAAQILQVFGRNLESGISRISPGTIFEIKVINRGTAPCAVVSNPTGGDGSAVICYTGAYDQLGTGAIASSGLPTRICLEWLEVNSGTQGATGLYCVYA